MALDNVHKIYKTNVLLNTVHFSVVSRNFQSSFSCL